MTPEELRDAARALLDQHPPEYREDLESRMLSMSTEKLTEYVELRRDVSLAFFTRRDREYFKPYDLAPEPRPAVKVPDRRDPDDWPDGTDARLFGDEPDLVRGPR